MSTNSMGETESSQLVMIFHNDGEYLDFSFELSSGERCTFTISVTATIRDLQRVIQAEDEAVDVKFISKDGERLSYTTEIRSLFRPASKSKRYISINGNSYEMKMKIPAKGKADSDIHSKNTSNTIGSPCFADIRRSNLFIDKTLLIETLFNLQQKIFLITAPPRFGKSVNVDMLREFVQIRDNRFSYHNLTGTLFEGTNIAAKPDVIRAHFGNHPVLQLNLAGIPTNFDSVFCLIWHKMTDLFRKHDLRQSSKLSDIEKKYYCDWCEYKEVKYSESNEAYLLHSLYELSRLLQKHHGRNTIILVDEFDSLVMNAMFSVSSNDLLKIIKLRDMFLGNVIKNFSGKCTYDLAVLTGVADVCAVTSPLRSLNRFRFSQEPILLPYYGIIDSEFEKITQDLSPELRTTLIEWYNGYSSHEANIYNPWSLTKAIVSKKTAHYWLEETNIIYKFQHLMNDNKFSILTKKLIIGEEIICDLSLETVLSCEDLQKITRCFQNCGVLEVNIILVFLYQLGYLTSSRKNLLKIPNHEISEAFKRLIHDFVEHGNIRCHELHTAAADLRQCLEEDFKIDNFRRSFEIICEHYNPKFVFNHQVIHSLLFAIILRTSVQWEMVGLECPIEEFYVGSKRCDIVLLFPTLLLIIEVKCNCDVDVALKQIETRNYLHIIQNRKIFKDSQIEKIERYVCMAICVSEKRKVSMKVVIKNSSLKTIEEHS